MVGEKIQQAVQILQEKNIDVWLVFARETSSTPDPMLDLILGTSVTWQSAFVISSSGKAVAIVGSLDEQNIKDHAPYEVIGYVDSIKKPLLDLLSQINPNKIAINYSTSDVIADGLTHGMYLALIDYLKETEFVDKLIPAESVISALRGRKSEGEIERIKAAIDVTLEIFEQVSKYAKVEMSEKEVAEFIKKQVKDIELDFAWDEAHCPAVFTGPDTAGAHAGPTDRQIQPGHIMNIDFGVRKNGYVSDLQRTWYFLKHGETDAPEEVKRGFYTIRDSIQAAAQELKPGKEGREIDSIARDFITRAGYEEYPHALGHQVGRKAHDGAGLLCPVWDRYKNLPYLKVEAGQVYTLEPRLTVKGYGIATIEEIVVVRKNGCEFLSTPQTELILI